MEPFLDGKHADGTTAKRDANLSEKLDLARIVGVGDFGDVIGKLCNLHRNISGLSTPEGYSGVGSQMNSPVGGLP